MFRREDRRMFCAGCPGAQDGQVRRSEEDMKTYTSRANELSGTAHRMARSHDAVHVGVG